MELNRAARYLEILLAFSWLLLFHWRLRSVPMDDRISAAIHAALQPVRIAASTGLVVGAVLWLERGTQPYAHAVTITSLIAFVLARNLGRRSTSAPRDANAQAR